MEKNKKIGLALCSILLTNFKYVIIHFSFKFSSQSFISDLSNEELLLFFATNYSLTLNLINMYRKLHFKKKISLIYIFFADSRLNIFLLNMHMHVSWVCVCVWITIILYNMRVNFHFIFNFCCFQSYVCWCNLLSGILFEFYLFINCKQITDHKYDY